MLYSGVMMSFFVFHFPFFILFYAVRYVYAIVSSVYRVIIYFCTIQYSKYYNCLLTIAKTIIRKTIG